MKNHTKIEYIEHILISTNFSFICTPEFTDRYGRVLFDCLDEPADIVAAP
jgi:hypothetical protein